LEPEQPRAGARALWIAACASLLAVLPAALWLDRPVALAARDARLVQSRVLQAFTEFGEGAWWLVPSAIVFALAAWRKRHNLARWAFALFVAVAASGIVANLLKIAIGKTRPKLLFESDRYGFSPFTRGYDFASMPSGHATTCGAAAMVLALALPRWRWPLLVGGVALASTRVAIHAHYASDVLAGLALGFATALATLAAWRKWWPESVPVGR
jgi:undecaprenyl-diphosphatase